jgi:hypothetical protein
VFISLLLAGGGASRYDLSAGGSGGMLVLMMGHLGIIFDDVFSTGAIS